MEDDRLEAAMAEQLTYYRRAAANFDRYVYRALFDEVISRLRERVDLSGDVLEIACGAGQWTERLAESARFLTALDAAPEMLEFARKRLEGCRADQVELICTNVFDWRPRRQYQAVFFAFWLSHVPPTRFAAFWKLLASCLGPNGRVAFVDDGPGAAAFEDDLDANQELPTAGRRLPVEGWTRGWAPISPLGSGSGATESNPPGSDHRVVKVFYDAEGLVRSLAELGWTAQVYPLGATFIAGWAQPVSEPV